MSGHGGGSVSLPESAVAAKLVHALESPRPRLRSYVTVPTCALGYLERVLPGRALDAVANAISDAELG